MQVRGAPLIGVDGCLRAVPGAARRPVRRGARGGLRGALLATRPTAVNLRWALDEMRSRAATKLPPVGARWVAAPTPGPPSWPTRTRRPVGPSASTASRCSSRRFEAGGGEPVHVLTHCNAGWLACVDWGTALAPVYLAHERGISGPRVGRRDAAHATRVRRSPPGSSASTASPTRCSPTTPGATSCSAAGWTSVPGGHRPHHCNGRRLQQDRHLPEGAGRPRQRRALLRGGCPRPAIDWSLAGRPRGRSRSRSAPAARRGRACAGARTRASGELAQVTVVPDKKPRREPRLRRHTGAARHRRSSPSAACARPPAEGLLESLPRTPPPLTEVRGRSFRTSVVSV